MHIVSPNGSIVAELENPAVSRELLQEILSWKIASATPADIIDRLRKRCVPAGFSPKPWIAGREENEADKLRSILSQMEYKHQVCYWDQQGVPFKSHIYVPEEHPITKSEFHEREDDAHVLKVNCLCYICA